MDYLICIAFIIVFFTQLFIMKTLADLQADVTAEETVIDSAITLLNGLSALLKANAGNPQAINDLATSIEAKSQALAEAVTANTPAQ